MNIVYYITSHGFGHAVRSAAICNCFSPGVKVIFRSALPGNFFNEEINVPFENIYARYDCGCIQRDGVTVDVEETLKVYTEIAEQNKMRLSEEVALCKKLNANCIVSDITPFAMEIARSLNIPSVAIGNFTWYDIYREYLDSNKWFEPYLRQIRNQYSMASLYLSLHPAIKTDYFNTVKQMPVVGRKGVCRKKEIREKFAIDRKKRLALIYTGNFGLENVMWSRLEQFTNWEFLGVYPLSERVSNYHLVTKELFSYQDLSASADMIIGKLGYGVLSESLLHAVPLVFIPRTMFSEYPLLESESLSSGLGYRMSQEQFNELNWSSALEWAIKSKENKPQPRVSSAQLCAREIEAVAKTTA
ncbi:hypothetical protein CHISP_2968 [Chitinispirillum alkaliphilum]|nr:hypothetical protein CHISP_2968 [Chitinispirillum alkaliphilum]